MPVTRDEHFKRLNSYRQSREYAEHSVFPGHGAKLPPDMLPSLLGVRWEITEEIYMEFLEILPPLRWTGRSFLMSEFCFGSITNKYTQEGSRYFCEFFDAKKAR